MIPGTLNSMSLVTDPFSFDMVQLQLHCDGTEGSTTFIDSSSYARTVTAVGTADLTTTSPKFGTACLDVATPSYIRTAKDANLAFGTGDFTIECFFKTNNVSTPDIRGGLIGSSAIGAGNLYFGLNGATSTSPTILTFNPIHDSITGQLQFAIAPYHIFDGNWHHFAVSREAGVTRMFCDGDFLIENTYSYDLNSITGFYEFGTTNSRSTGTTSGVENRKLRCYLDEIRFIKGYALYTDNYDVPTEAFNDY